MRPVKSLLLLVLAGSFLAPVIAVPAERSAAELKASIEKHNAFIKDPTERAVKAQAMGLSPFTFYRATAHLFYEDIFSGRLPIPEDWRTRRGLDTWISGDFHFQNVGFEDPHQTLRFELNDFDESCEAPFYWDLLRLAASIYLIKDSRDWQVDERERLNEFTLTNEEADGLILKFFERYSATLAADAIPAMSAKEVREPSDRPRPKLHGEFVRNAMMAVQTNAEKKIEKLWKEETGGSKTRFMIADTKRFAELPTERAAAMETKWSAYVCSLDPAFVRNTGGGYFTILDRAKRLGSGLGSLGVEKIYVLLEGSTTSPDDNVIVELKECMAPAPVEAGALPTPLDGHTHGRRVSQAIRAMVADPDPLEGWLDVGGVSYHVSRISPLADGLKLKDFKAEDDLEDFLEWTAMALANSHTRANVRFASTAYTFFDAGVRAKLQQLAGDYAAQVLKDFAAYRTFQTAAAAANQPAAAR
jgi:uncharacterized protein (DUF2252 family)